MKLIQTSQAVWVECHEGVGKAVFQRGTPLRNVSPGNICLIGQGYLPTSSLSRSRGEPKKQNHSTEEYARYMVLTHRTGVVALPCNL